MARRLLGDLYVEMTAEFDGWVSGMESAGRSVGRLEREVKDGFKSISRSLKTLNFLVGAELATQMASFVSGFSRGIEETGRFADRIGVATEELSRLQYVAQSSGVPVDAFNDALQEQVLRLTEAAQGNEAYQESIAAIGLDLERMVNLSPDEQFREIAAAMNELSTQAERVVAAEQIWGDEGIQLLQITNQGAEAIAEMAAEAENLGAVIGDEAVRDAAEYNRSIERLSTAFSTFAQTVLPLIIPPLTSILNSVIWTINAFKDLGNNIVAFVRRALVPLGLASAEVSENMDDVPATLNRITVQLPKTAAATKETKDEIDKFIDSLIKQEKAIEMNEVKLAALDDWYDRLSPEQQVRQQDFYNESLEKLGVNLGDATDDFQSFRDELRNQQDALENTQRKIELLVEWYEALDPTEQAENLIYFEERFRELSGAIDEVVEKDLATWQTLVTRSLERLDDAFQNFWVSIIDGSESTFDAFKRVAIETLAEIIHAYTTREIVAKIKTVITDTAGKPTGQGAGEQGGGGIINTILSGLSAITGNVLGALAGVAVGSLLGGLFGGDNKIKETRLFTGNLLRPVGGFSTATESPFGRFIEFGLHRFGGEGQLSNQQAQEALNTLEAAAKVMVGIDEIIAETLNATEFAGVEQALAALPERSQDFSEQAVSRFITERFTAIFGVVDEALGEAFKELSAPLTGDALLAFANDVALLNQAMVEGDQVFSDIATTAETLNTLMKEFAADGETLAGVLERLAQANAALSELGFGTGTSAEQLFNLEVLEQFGNDAGRLQGLISGFFESFFTETENLERNIGRLGGIVPELLSELGTTREGFASDFLANVTEGILSPEDVRLWLEAGEALSALIDLEQQLTTIRETEAAAIRQEEINAINDQVSAMEASIAAIDDQIAAQQLLRAEIDAISDAITQSFGNSIQSIQLALLDSEGQYDFLRNNIESLSAAIDTMTDPAGIQQALETINSQAMQAFGLLSGEQQQVVGQEFIDFLQTQLTAGQERLTQLSEEAFANEQALMDQRERKQDEIANLMAEAAAINAQASETFSSAAQQFALAAAQPQTVQVTLTTEMVGG